MKKLATLFALSLLGLGQSIQAREVRLQDCPPKVQATITEEAKGGRIDEINVRNGVYVAEVDLSRGRDLEIRVNRSGRLLLLTEDVRFGQLPGAVKRAIRRLSRPNGQVDDIDKVTENRKVTYHVEIEREGQRDLRVVLSKRGRVLESNRDN